MSALLPKDFADLEGYAETWALPTEAERYGMRLASTVEEMRAFYDAIVPRYDAAVGYLEQFPLDSLPEDATRLLHLLYSMMQASFPVEVWHQPRVPDSGSASFDCHSEPVP
jgi:hypothetical protein